MFHVVGRRTNRSAAGRNGETDEKRHLRRIPGGAHETPQRTGKVKANSPS
jgi:hypothetical protein